ncbi:MAG: arylsulfatase [Alphaproteobacteria bacterium]|nr:arylsulfatase [Alphaproteobacteria bacterium]
MVATAARPNVILVLVDDMGFSDLGLMGSEIRTPNVDALARNGALLSSMYNCARCCPTRAALLTGLYPHKAGIGHMGANLGSPAYQGYLRNDAATIAELMRLGGYRTLMSGKWHVGGDFWARLVDTWRVGDVDRPTPRQRGFDRFFGIIDGVTHFFSPHYIMEDDSRVEVSPTDFYFTDVITDKAIGMMEESVSRDQPFFLYLAHAAPHWPLHAHEEDIARYDGIYAKGWDAIRTARHEEMTSRGVLQHNWAISPRDAEARPWGDIRQQDWEASRMAVYAAMIDRMDQSIGRVVATLKRLGQFEDTLILFLSDNGGCAEFMAEDGWAKFMPDIHNDGRRITMGNRPGLRPGGPLTYMSYDLPWANVSNAPFRLFKHWVHEGGISTPLIAHWPRRITQPRVAHEPCHVIDLLPTILSATGVAYPSELGGAAIQKLDGEDITPLIEGRNWHRERPLFWEHEGNAAVRIGNFKLVRKFNQPWELYDMERDRTELNDLMGRNEPLTKQLTRAYDAWAAEAGVLDWNVALPKLLSLWRMDNAHG